MNEVDLTRDINFLIFYLFLILCREIAFHDKQIEVFKKLFSQRKEPNDLPDTIPQQMHFVIFFVIFMKMG